MDLRTGESSGSSPLGGDRFSLRADFKDVFSDFTKKLQSSVWLVYLTSTWWWKIQSMMINNALEHANRHLSVRKANTCVESNYTPQTTNKIIFP